MFVHVCVPMCIYTHPYRVDAAISITYYLDLSGTPAFSSNRQGRNVPLEVLTRSGRRPPKPGEAKPTIREIGGSIIRRWLLLEALYDDFLGAFIIGKKHDLGRWTPETPHDTPTKALFQSLRLLSYSRGFIIPGPLGLPSCPTLNLRLIPKSPKPSLYSRSHKVGTSISSW